MYIGCPDYLIVCQINTVDERGEFRVVIIVVTAGSNFTPKHTLKCQETLHEAPFYMRPIH